MEGGFHPMSNSSQGTYQIDLRETVHLSYEQLPIEEIEEMELVPQVRVAALGDEIEISGCLCLQGEYKGNQNSGKLDSNDQPAESYEESVQFEPLAFERGPYSPLVKQSTFEYKIPVKILLPKNRVREVEDIYANVVSFDYDLKSPYQIDVVATFAISGFKDEEELDLPLAEPIEEELNLLEETLAKLEAASSHEEHPVGEKPEEAEEANEMEHAMESPAEWEEITEEPAAEAEQTPPEQAEPEEQALPDNVIPLPHVQPTDENQEEIVEEKTEKDVKVAISKKGTQKDREAITSLSSIFSRAPKKEANSAQAYTQQEEENKSAPEEPAVPSEPIYLTNFMEEKEERFAKLKMCILQKDETVEGIAERYNISVETILRANQAGHSQIAPGQILYIPMKG
jgi:stage VI sporulation protein D